MHDSFKFLDRLESLAGRATDRRIDASILGDALGGDLHHTASAVGHQQEILAVLRVDDHVERLVAVAQFRDGRAASFFTWLEAAHRKFYERRASEARQQARFAVDVDRQERADDGVVFQTTVSTVINLDARASVRVGERERNLAHVRGRSTRDAGDVNLSLGVREVGNRVTARVARTSLRHDFFVLWSVRQFDLLHRYLLQTDLAELAIGRDLDERRAAGLRDRQEDVPRQRIHGEITDRDFVRIHAEQFSDLRIQTRDIDFDLGGIPLGVARADCENRGTLRIADEQNSIRAERERACGLELRSPFFQAPLRSERGTH